VALDGAFAGELIGPDHADYDRARRVWNGTVDRRPALIARCGGPADVAAALAFARDGGLPVAVRGGGHNVSGNAVCDDGVVIDLSGMKAVSVDPEQRVARVGPGVCSASSTPRRSARARDPDRQRVEDGHRGADARRRPRLDRAAPRAGVRQPLAAEVVTADGTVVRASEGENPDLLWGLRGGGGNFGVVTRSSTACTRSGRRSSRAASSTRSPTRRGCSASSPTTSPMRPDALSVVASTFRATPPMPVPPAFHGELVTALAVCGRATSTRASACSRPCGASAPRSPTS
jgi:hypothetical protein